MTRLGILIEEEATTVASTSAKVKLTWLVDLYHRYIESGSCVWSAMTYLLHLIDSMIFANKSLTHVHVAYLLYLDNRMLAQVRMGSHCTSLPIRPFLLCEPVPNK